MLADFAVRLACGLAVLLLLTPGRVVPPPFFRTQCQVMLGLLVLAALDIARSGEERIGWWTVGAAAVLAYASSVTWGLGLTRVALPLTACVALIGGGVLGAASWSPLWPVWALNAAGRLTSAFLMGATLSAMLLGHYYLTAPAMSIDPLRRHVRCLAWGLGARAIVGALALWCWQEGWTSLGHRSAIVSPFFLAMRWGVGILGTAIAVVLTWKTVQIRSTQSATGILYVALTLTLCGELTALILSRSAGLPF
jgi:hypothetical protein